jgi:hypothetical protein
MLRASRIAGRPRYIEMLTKHRRSGGDEDLPEVRTEMFVGAGHHVSGEELEQGDAESLRERLDQLIQVSEFLFVVRTPAAPLSTTHAGLAAAIWLF